MYASVWLKSKVRAVAGPAVQQARRSIYALRFHRRLEQLQSRYGTRVLPQWSVGPSFEADAVWNRLRAVVPAGVALREISLADDAEKLGSGQYWKRFSGFYRTVGCGREKALEHSLTFELLDFSRVRRYCDVASSRSPITDVFAEAYPQVEYWRQDLVFQTDLKSKIIGGFAQNMRDVESGFFDALGLHCSFEHFWENSDSEFIAEVDRLLSPTGACLIVPLYLDGEHRVYLDPTVIGDEQIARFDRDARLCPAFDYRQDHGRYYDPESLVARVLSKLPPSLRATVLRFDGGSEIDPGIYLRFGLVLHRQNSVFTAR